MTEPKIRIRKTLHRMWAEERYSYVEWLLGVATGLVAGFALAS